MLICIQKRYMYFLIYYILANFSKKRMKIFSFQFTLEFWEPVKLAFKKEK